MSIEAPRDGASETVLAAILGGDEIGNPGLQRLENLPRAIGAPIVDDHDFVWHLLKAQLDMEMFHRRGNAAFLVPRGNDDGEQIEFSL